MKNVLMFFLILFIAGCATMRIEKEIDYKHIKKVDTLDDILINLNKDKNFEEIIKLYEEKNQLFNNSEKLNYVIRAYFEKKQYESVISVVQKNQNVLKKSANKDIVFAEILGISYYKTGNFDQAQRFLEIAWDNSDSEEISIYLSLLYLKKGQYSLSIMATTKLPEGKKEFVQGLIYTKMKNWQKALEHFENIKDRNYKAFAFTAYCYYMMGNFDQAEKVVTDERVKNDFLSNIIMALILVEKGYVKKGQLMLEKLRKDLDESSPYAHAINYNLEVIYELYLDSLKIGKKENL